MSPKIEPTSLNLLHCRRILYPLSHLEALSLYLPTIDVRSPRIRDVQNILHPVTLQVSEDTCYTRMGRIKSRNGKDLTEAEEVKKRWQEYTELYKKDLNNPENYDGVVTHLEPAGV